ncbi:hypothetical protein BHE74_00059438 [Ensete ventricosum]|nr:hypothetical protein BHE74_00059438 [Ensete ventricosum]
MVDFDGGDAATAGVIGRSEGQREKHCDLDLSLHFCNRRCQDLRQLYGAEVSVAIGAKVICHGVSKKLHPLAQSPHCSTTFAGTSPEENNRFAIEDVVPVGSPCLTMTA